MKLVRNRTIPITLMIGKNVLVDVMFKIRRPIGYAIFDTNTLQRPFIKKTIIFFTCYLKHTNRNEIRYICYIYMGVGGS